MDSVKQQIRHAWDHDAESYDGRWSHGIKTPPEHRAWTALLRRLLPSEGMRVLDVGCGPGVLSLIIAELGHEVTGLAIAPRMLEVAARRARSGACTSSSWRVTPKPPTWQPKASTS
jgi:2-polyprenyl-3-methyl-5-hydroxy-6-metoxy-1,4-benzoquinol methylase